MRKNYVFHFIFLLLLNISMFGQKVIITPQVVNGKSVVSTSPINLESVDRSSVSLSVKIESPIPVGSEGTLSILFTKDAAITPVVAEGGFERVTNFIGRNSATISFVITLNLSTFNTTGGSISAQYKSFSGLIYKSNNVSVIKNGSTPITPPVTPPLTPPITNVKNTICCDQVIRYGDKPAPIVGSTLDPKKVTTQWVKIDNGNKYYNGWNYSNDKTNILTTDYLTENATFKRWVGSDYPYSSSNAISITIVPSPILNEIFVTDAGPNSDGFIEIIDTNPKQIGSGRAGREVNLNILQDPNHIAQRGDSFDNVERYEWQYAGTNQKGDFPFKNWINIENGNTPVLEHFTPKNISNIEENYFVLRRIATYKGIQRASNLLKIIPRKVSFNNMICCDQILIENSVLNAIEKPSIIIGSIPSLEDLNTDGKNYKLASISYQWQSQSITNTRPNTYGTWSNIAGATVKDYLPNPLQFTVNSRGGLVVQTTYNYRRIATINYYSVTNGSLTNVITKSYSNEINVKNGRSYGVETLIVYPNPASSIINIENKGTDFILANTKISVVNTMGNIVNSNNFSTISPNLISIDVSDLVIGTYFITIETGLGSRSNKQLTFIKVN
ncbi:MAG: T9SS type A sorting domain-containing protein [Flavobacterium circumlabens]|uniref:T9SS type A sorting domain-containing protein n=1 Tax=Flavobacterium circumlabens TaxID=2133765 RepID=UPI003267C720